MFFNRGVFVIEMFSYAVVDEACRVNNVLLIAAVTRELVHCIYIYIRPIFYTFRPTLSLHIQYIARSEYFLIPDDAVDRRKLGFKFLLFEQQFKASLEQFYHFYRFHCLK